MVEKRARKIEEITGPVNLYSKKIVLDETEYSTGINWVEFIGEIDLFLSNLVINVQNEYIPLRMLSSGDFFKDDPLDKNNPYLGDDELYCVAKGISSDVSSYIDEKYNYVFGEIMDKYAETKDVSRSEREEAMKKFYSSIEANSAYSFITPYSILSNRRNLFNQIMNNIGKFNC